MRISLRDHGTQVQLQLDDPSDHISARIIRRREWYEKDLLEDLYMRRPHGGTAIDVGAHIGNHTMWFAAVCGLRTVSLEPNPVTRAQLELNVKLNGLSNRVQILPVAAGASFGSARLEELKPGNTGMTRAVPDDAGDIEMIPIDSLELTDVEVIKVDAEGAELAILAGAYDTLTRCKPLLYIEAEQDERREALERFLEPLGYTCFGKYTLTPTYGFSAARTRALASEPVLSATIMAHPARQRFVGELVSALDGPVSIAWDRIGDRWETGRRALLSYDPEATHHLAIQDDAVVCRDLLAGTRDRIREHPHSPISLYLGRQRPHGAKFTQLMAQARATGDRWIAFRELCWGVALVLPTDLIVPIVAWGDENSRIQNYDMRISKWLEGNRIETLYTVPSLVDHRRQAESPSLIREPNGKLRNGANRVAHWFIGGDESALGEFSEPIMEPADGQDRSQVGSSRDQATASR